MNVLVLALVSLAIYRLSLMIATEDGPVDLFRNFREQILIVFEEDHWITRGVHCPMCISFWLAFLGALFCSPPSIVMYFITALALSGFVVFLILVGGIAEEE